MISVATVIESVSPAPGQEANIQLLTNQAISLFERKTERTWSLTSGSTLTVEKNDRQGRRTPILLWHPNLSVTKVEEWESSPTDDIETLDLIVSGTGDYWVDSSTLAARVIKVSEWDRFVRITYDCGWSVLPAAFSDITLALIEQVKYTLERYGDGKRITNSQAFDGSSTTYKSGMMCDHMVDAIRYYRAQVID